MVEPVKNFIIGIGAPQHVGKTTVGDIIQGLILERSPMSNILRLGFATRLKEICGLLGHTGEKDDRGRAFYQDVGAAARKYDEDVWVKLARARIEQANEGCLMGGRPIVIIDDLRHPNEAAWVNSCDGLSIRVFGEPRLPVTGDPNHESETRLAECNFNAGVNNDGTITELRSVVEVIFLAAIKARGWKL